MQNQKLKAELSEKFAQMSKTLMSEGVDLKDQSITRVGSIFMLLSTIILFDEDIFLFHEFCSMFSAKKIIEAINEQDGGKYIDDFFNRTLPEDSPVRKDVSDLRELKEKLREEFKTPIKKIPVKKAVVKKAQVKKTATKKTPVKKSKRGSNDSQS